MKIVHIVSAFPPYRGGMGQAAHAQCLALRQKGIDVHVVTPDYGTHFPVDFPFQVSRLRPRFGLATGNAALLPRLDKNCEGADLVHLHYPFYGATGAVLRWKRVHPKTPLVMTYHMDTLGAGLRAFVFARHRRRYLADLLKACDQIQVSSLDYAATSFLAPHWAEIENKIVEQPFGVDTSRFNPDGERANIAHEYGLGAEDFIALFVGGLDRAHYFKGVGVLLEAAAALVAAGEKRIHFFIVGEGDMRNAYEIKSEEKGIIEQAHFLGNVSDEELPGVYRAADCLILPSRDRSEAFGLVLLEAMASGKPVIASDLPGVRTLFTEGVEGLRVPPGNSERLASAIMKLVNDRIKLRAMGENARRRIVSDYNMHKTTEKLLQHYNNVIY